MRLTATLESGGGNTTGIEVPAEVVEALGAGKRPKIRLTFKDYTYRGSIAPMGGRFYIGISAEVRAATGVAAGDPIDAELELDTEPRVVAVPDDLAAALDRQPAARRAFDALSYSSQRRHVLAVEGAKTAETRARRIDKVVSALTDGGS